MFGNSPKAPAAQAKVDELTAKKRDADAKLAQCKTNLEHLNYQSELPDGEGVVVSMSDIAKARANRDRAQDEVDRLAGALTEAERRLADARAADAIEGDRAAWARQTALAAELDRDFKTVFAAFETAASLASAYIAKRTELLRGHPASKTSFRGTDLSGMQEGILTREGMDRLLRLSQLTVATFHADFRKHPGSSHLTEVPEIIKRETLFLAAAAKRPAIPQGPQAA